MIRLRKTVERVTEIARYAATFIDPLGSYVGQLAPNGKISSSEHALPVVQSALARALLRQQVCSFRANQRFLLFLLESKLPRRSTAHATRLLRATPQKSKTFDVVIVVSTTDHSLPQYPSSAQVRQFNAE